MRRQPWRKILYEEQDFPDNYVDKAQFLNGLKKNCKNFLVLLAVSSRNVAIDYTLFLQKYILRLTGCRR